MKDILEKGDSDAGRSQLERQRLYEFVRAILLSFIRPVNQSEILFAEFVKQIVKERLHLKTYTAGEIIYDEGERMDSLNVVLEGHVVKNDRMQLESDGDTDASAFILRQNEILGLTEIPDIQLSMHDDIQIKPMKLEKTEKT